MSSLLPSHSHLNASLKQVCWTHQHWTLLICGKTPGKVGGFVFFFPSVATAASCALLVPEFVWIRGALPAPGLLLLIYTSLGLSPQEGSNLQWQPGLKCQTALSEPGFYLKVMMSSQFKLRTSLFMVFCSFFSGRVKRKVSSQRLLLKQNCFQSKLKVNCSHPSARVYCTVN